MKIVALMPCRNEAWCLGYTARQALRWCDALLVLAHACTDNTVSVLREINSEHPGRMGWTEESNPAWNEADYRQKLLEHGRKCGAEHFALIDADESLCETELETTRGLAESLEPGACIRLPWKCLWRSLANYRTDDSPFGRAMVPVVFRDAPGLAHVASAGNYQLHKRIPSGAKITDIVSDGGILHLQHASWIRVLAKQLWYQMTELLTHGRVIGNYAGTVDETGLKLAEVPPGWWGPSADRIDLSAAPWQAEDCRRMLALHGERRFATCSLLARARESGIV